MRNFVLFVAFVLTTSAFANSLQGFERRFKIVRNDKGDVVAIKDTTLSPKFKIKPFIDQIKVEVAAHRNAMMSKDSDYLTRLDEFYRELEGHAKTNDEVESIRVVRESLENLPNIDFDRMMNNPKIKELIAKFELKMKDALALLSLNTVARLDDSRYFFKKQVTYQAVKFALDLAKKIFSRVPLLNTASYIAVRVEQLVRETRTYHQNMLLHYFQHFTPAELGMTKKEIDIAASSIFESRISPFNIFESRTAQDTWNVYGFRKLYQMVRFGQNRLRTLGPVYDALGDKLNYAFRDVTLKSEPVIINLLDNTHMFSRKPPVAYHYNNPKKVEQTRTLIRLAQVGLSYIPISDGIKDLVNTFIDSFYKKQKLTEGALVAHFESQGDTQMAKAIFRGSINPFDNF